MKRRTFLEGLLSTITLSGLVGCSDEQPTTPPIRQAQPKPPVPVKTEQEIEAEKQVWVENEFKKLSVSKADYLEPIHQTRSSSENPFYNKYMDVEVYVNNNQNPNAPYAIWVMEDNLIGTIRKKGIHTDSRGRKNQIYLAETLLSQWKENGVEHAQTFKHKYIKPEGKMTTMYTEDTIDGSGSRYHNTKFNPTYEFKNGTFVKTHSNEGSHGGEWSQDMRLADRPIGNYLEVETETIVNEKVSTQIGYFYSAVPEKGFEEYVVSYFVIFDPKLGKFLEIQTYDGDSFDKFVPEKLHPLQGLNCLRTLDD